MEELEERMRVIDEEHSLVWDRVGEIGDAILRTETLAMSLGIRELCFIETVCEDLVKRFNQEMKQKSTEREHDEYGNLNETSGFTRSEIQKDLETAQRKFLEQMILPSVVEVEGFGPLFYQDLVDFVGRMKQGLKNSRKLQKDMEAHVTKKMKKLGEEKRLVVMTPVHEVVKGFPEVELKWMFGHKEVVVPKAIRLHLYHGWKKWREEANANLKRNLMEDVDFAKQYVAQIQELYSSRSR